MVKFTFGEITGCMHAFSQYVPDVFSFSKHLKQGVFECFVTFIDSFRMSNRFTKIITKRRVKLEYNNFSNNIVKICFQRFNLVSIEIAENLKLI